MLTGLSDSDRRRPAPGGTLPLPSPRFRMHTPWVEQLVAVVVIVFRGDRVLTMRRATTNEAAPTIWESVSGRVAPGEDPRDAAAREALEETGLAVRVSATPVDAYAMERKGRPMVVIVYRGDAPAGEVIRNDEHDAHEWLTRNEARSRMPTRLALAAERAGTTRSGR